MFDVLVESTSQRRGARMWAYFAASSVVWLGIFASVAIAGVMTYDARLDAEFDDIGLIAFVPDAAPPKAIEESHPTSAPRQPDQFVAPTQAPTTIALPRSAPPSTGPSTGGLPDGASNGVTGGVPGGNGTGPAGLPSGTGAGPVDPVDDPPPAPEPDPPQQPPPARTVSKGPLNGFAIHRVTPPYPEMARRAGVGGEVIVSVSVSELGVVTSAKVLKGHPLLNDAAVRAAYGWRFSPTTLGGVPVKVVGTITFNFKKS